MRFLLITALLLSACRGGGDTDGDADGDLDEDAMDGDVDGDADGSHCAAPMTDCDSLCVNTATDANNCGMCGRVCGSMESCCTRQCVDLSSDVGNCGFCGNGCPSGVGCISGQCRLTDQEVCNNIDDDGDGLIDEGLTRECTNCLGSGEETCVSGLWQGCTAPTPGFEVCSDGEDNDCDGFADMDDPDCTGCVPDNGGMEDCDDGRDNDCDGLTDGDDPDCE